MEKPLSGSSTNRKKAYITEPEILKHFKEIRKIRLIDYQQKNLCRLQHELIQNSYSSVSHALYCVAS
ncbi:hypothetical protein Glove_122g9 [Diversispora epigaea]|uniref:Uncharacterized protein n=1 Tax=Diversispora epigaea TaxID=1348612 RepID=A0A397J3I7_9GLOM|nr:hypothetical protein Glove_122g9 [Diversispora epigaea]